MSDRTPSAERAASMLVVGIGNPDRGDDGIGPLVARLLADIAPPGVRVVERGGDALALIDTWSGSDALVLIDAAQSTAAPGHIHRIDLLTEELPRELSLASTHGFGIADTIALAATLGLMPRRVVVYAIEAAHFEAGAPITPAVAGAADEAVRRIVAELAALRTDAKEERVHA